MKKASFGFTIQRVVKILCSNVGYIFIFTKALSSSRRCLWLMVCVHVCRMAGSWECCLWRSLGTGGVSLSKCNLFHIICPLKLAISFNVWSIYLCLHMHWNFSISCLYFLILHPYSYIWIDNSVKTPFLTNQILLSCIVRWLLLAIRWPGCGMWSLENCWAASRVTSAASSLLRSHHRRKVYEAFCVVEGCRVCRFLSTDARRHSVYTFYKPLCICVILIMNCWVT